MVAIIRVARRRPAPPPNIPEAATDKSASLADLPPHTLGDDLLEGADAIARFLYGPTAHARRAHTAIKGRLPVWKLGNRYYARKSSLLRWIEEQERMRST